MHNLLGANLLLEPWEEMLFEIFVPYRFMLRRTKSLIFKNNEKLSYDMVDIRYISTKFGDNPVECFEKKRVFFADGRTTEEWMTDVCTMALALQ